MSKFWIRFTQLIIFLYNTIRIISCLLQIVSSILIKRSIYWIKKLNFPFANIHMTEERTVCQNISVTENHFDDDGDSSMISAQQDDEQSSSSSFQQQAKQLVDQPSSFRSSQNLNSSGSGIRNTLNTSKELDVGKENGESFSKTSNVCCSKSSLDGITRATYCPHCQHANGNGTNNNKQWPLLYLEDFNVTDVKLIEWENKSEFPLSTSCGRNAQIGDTERSMINNKEISDKGSFIKTHNCDIGQSFVSGSNFGNSIHQANQHVLDYQNQEVELGNTHREHTKSVNSNLFLGNFGDASIDKELLIGNEKYQTSEDTKSLPSIDLISWETPDENLKFQANQIESKGIAKTLDEKNDLISGDIYDLILEQNKGDSTHLTEFNIKEIPNEESMLDFCDVERDALSCVLKEDNASKNGMNAPQKGMKQIIRKPPRSGKVSSKASEKMSSQSFSMVGDYDAGEAEHKQSENECKNNHEIKNHHTMVFGLCSDCAPVESNETVKNVCAVKILSKSSRSSTSFIDGQSRFKARNANKRRVRQKNALKKSTKTNKKRVSFSEKISIFSYNPNHSVFEIYYGPLEKEQNNIKQTTKARVKNFKVISGAAQKKSEKTSLSYYPPVLKTDSQPTDIRNPSINTEETHSKTRNYLIKTEETPSEIRNPLIKTKESPSEIQNLLIKTEETPSEIQNPLIKTEEIPSEIQNPLIKTEETPSETHRSLTRMKEPLVNVTGPSYYENLGLILDDASSCLFEIDCVDDACPSTAFEEDDNPQLMSEKACLIGGKNKPYLVNLSDMTRQTQAKAKKWLKNSSKSLKKTVYKKFKNEFD